MDKVRKNKLIEIMTPYEPLEIVGDKFVTALKMRHVETKAEKTLDVNGVFKEIGHIVDIASIKHLVRTNERNEVIIDDKNQTSVPGLFAAGDLTTVPYKQTVISAGEGAKAALSCYQWLTGAKQTSIDWEIKEKK